MTTTRSVTKNDLEVLSNLVFDSFITREMEFQGHHFIFRTLTTDEREDISRRYKYLSSKYNIYLVLEILSNCILYIDGYEFKSEHKYLLDQLCSRIVLKFYDFYKSIDNELTEATKFIDYYIETRDSRNSWLVFKTCSRITEPFSIKKFNQYQYYWIVLNCFKDSFDEEKKNWTKTEFMTNSICAYVNPKAYRKSRGRSITDQLDQNEDKSKQKIVEQLESGQAVSVEQSNDIFSTLNRLPGETQEEHDIRMNTIMEKTLKGEMIDEHDRIVRAYEINQFRGYLREKRKQILVEKELFKRRGIVFDSSEVLDNEELKKQDEEDKKSDFYFGDFNYLEIVQMKDFAALPKTEKKKIFDEVMAESIDLEKEVGNFLNSLSQENKSSLETQVSEQPPVTMVEGEEGTRDTQSDSSNERFVTAAEKAAKMNVNVKNIDLMKQRRDKEDRFKKAIDQRRQVKEIKEEDQDLDVIRFN